MTTPRDIIARRERDRRIAASEATPRFQLTDRQGRVVATASSRAEAVQLSRDNPELTLRPARNGVRRDFRIDEDTADTLSPFANPETGAIDIVAALEGGVDPSVLDRAVGVDARRRGETIAAALEAVADFRGEDGRIDAVGALQAGIDPQVLADILPAGGVEASQLTVSQLAEIAPFRNSEGGVDLVAAVDADVSEETLQALFESGQVMAAQTISQARSELQDRTPVQFIQQGGDPDVLRDLGVDDTTIDALTEVRPYLSSDGRIDARAALINGVSESALTTLGVNVPVIGMGSPGIPTGSFNVSSNNPFTSDAITAEVRVRDANEELRRAQQRFAEPGQSAQFYEVWGAAIVEAEGQIARWEQDRERILRVWNIHEAFGASTGLLDTSDPLSGLDSQQIQIRENLIASGEIIDVDRILARTPDALFQLIDPETGESVGTVAGQEAIDFAIADGFEVRPVTIGDAPDDDEDLDDEDLDDEDLGVDEESFSGLGLDEDAFTGGGSDDEPELVSQEEFDRFELAIERLQERGLARETDGGFEIDIAEASVRGFDDELLGVGITDDEIADEIALTRGNALAAREFREEADTRNTALLQLNARVPEAVTGAGGVDLSAADQAGQRELLLQAGFSEREIIGARLDEDRTNRDVQVALRAIQTLDPYLDGRGGIFTEEALRGGVPPHVLRDAGLDDQAIFNAQVNVSSTTTLATVTPGAAESLRESDRQRTVERFGFTEEMQSTGDGGDLRRRERERILDRFGFPPEVQGEAEFNFDFNLAGRDRFDRALIALGRRKQELPAQVEARIDDALERERIRTVDRFGFTPEMQTGDIDFTAALRDFQTRERERSLSRFGEIEGAGFDPQQGPVFDNFIQDLARRKAIINQGVTDFERQRSRTQESLRSGIRGIGESLDPRTIGQPLPPGTVPDATLPADFRPAGGSPAFPVPGLVPRGTNIRTTAVLAALATAAEFFRRNPQLLGDLTDIQRQTLQSTSREQVTPATVSPPAFPRQQQNITLPGIPVGVAPPELADIPGRTVRVPDLPGTDRRIPTEVVTVLNIAAEVEELEQDITRLPVPASVEEFLRRPTAIDPRVAIPIDVLVDQALSGTNAELKRRLSPKLTQLEVRRRALSEAQAVLVQTQPTAQPSLTRRQLPITITRPRVEQTVVQPELVRTTVNELNQSIARETELSRAISQETDLATEQELAQELARQQALTRVLETRLATATQSAVRPAPITRIQTAARTSTAARTAARSLTRTITATPARTIRRIPFPRRGQPDDEDSATPGAPNLRIAGINRGALDTTVDFSTGETRTVGDLASVPEGPTRQSFTKLSFGDVDTTPQRLPWGVFDLFLSPTGAVAFVKAGSAMPKESDMKMRKNPLRNRKKRSRNL